MFEKPDYIGELVHCGAGIPGGTEKGFRREGRLTVETIETFMAMRIVGDP